MKTLPIEELGILLQNQNLTILRLNFWSPKGMTLTCTQAVVTSAWFCVFWIKYRQFYKGLVKDSFN